MPALAVPALGITTMCITKPTSLLVFMPMIVVQAAGFFWVAFRSTKVTLRLSETGFTVHAEDGRQIADREWGNVDSIEMTEHWVAESGSPTDYLDFRAKATKSAWIWLIVPRELTPDRVRMYAGAQCPVIERTNLIRPSY